MQEQEDRSAGVMRASVVGIVANLLLAGAKALVGLSAGSIAIVLDALNNLTDVLSSFVTIVGTRLARKPPDRKHPYGHGRTEYLATMIISVVIISAGATALLEAVRSILSPTSAHYEPTTLVVVGIAVLTKLALGTYVRRAGVRLHSDALVASGTDALSDAVISATTLVAALVYMVTGISSEAWLASLIALAITKAGIDILREAISRVLGERVDPELAQGVRHAVEQVPGVRGAYDLLLQDFGPERLSGSIHVEVDEQMTAREVDVLTRAIQQRVATEHGILLHTVGIYSQNASAQGDVGAIRSLLLKLANDEAHVMQVHGFYVDEAERAVTFDLVVSWDAPDRHAVLAHVLAQLEERFPAYSFHATLDADMSD